jgi:hypothetical protein
MDPNTNAIRFPLGRVVATPGVLHALEAVGQDALGLLRRHQSGDWGTVCRDDAQANEQALLHGERLLSAYLLSDGRKVWVITEADRSSTCLLLPAEY